MLLSSTFGRFSLEIGNGELLIKTSSGGEFWVGRTMTNGYPWLAPGITERETYRSRARHFAGFFLVTGRRKVEAPITVPQAT